MMDTGTDTIPRRLITRICSNMLLSVKLSIRVSFSHEPTLWCSFQFFQSLIIILGSEHQKRDHNRKITLVREWGTLTQNHEKLTQSWFHLLYEPKYNWSIIHLGKASETMYCTRVLQLYEFSLFLDITKRWTSWISLRWVCWDYLDYFLCFL